MAMHGVLRARCVQFMLENADIFRPFLASDEAGETLEQYCEYMARVSDGVGAPAGDR